MTNINIHCIVLYAALYLLHFKHVQYVAWRFLASLLAHYCEFLVHCIGIQILMSTHFCLNLISVQCFIATIALLH